MTRAAKARNERRQTGPETRNPSRRLLLVIVTLALGGVILVVALWRSGVAETLSGVPAPDSGPVHVHGLGVDPADGALFIATHSGLYRVEAGAQTAARVGDRLQDTMGFTIVGPSHFLGSGHPDLREARERDLPPHLGLIESTDAGRNWKPISLLGEADFHVLRFAGDRLYGYDASNDRLLASADRGRTWAEIERPWPILDLAVSPGAPSRIVASSIGGSEEGLFESRDGGLSWTKVDDVVGLLAWPATGRLYLIDNGGRVFVSANGGRSFSRRGEVGGEPASLLAQAPNELYVALHDGTIERSTDGGTTWAVHSTP